MLVSNMKRGALETGTLSDRNFVLWLYFITFVVIGDFMMVFKMTHMVLKEYRSLVPLHKFVFNSFEIYPWNLEHSQ